MRLELTAWFKLFGGEMSRNGWEQMVPCWHPNTLFTLTHAIGAFADATSHRLWK
jgi:hypothetical protein